MDVQKAASSSVTNEDQVQQSPQRGRQNSLELIFTLTKEVLEGQLEQGVRLDSKADSMQVSAIALLGAALVLEAVLIPLNSSLPLAIRIIQAVLLLPLLIVHAVVVNSASGAYEISTYQGIHPKTLILKYLKVPEKVTKRELLKVMMNEFEDNEKIIDKKVKLIARAHSWRRYEAGILIVVLLIQVISILFIHSTK